MEGHTPHWFDWVNFDRVDDAQLSGYDDHQGDQAAEETKAEGFGALIAAPQDWAFEPLPCDQTWPFNESVVPQVPSAGWPSPSVSDSQPVNSQQHAQHFSMPELSVYAEPVPSTYVNHGALVNGVVLKDNAGVEQPMVDSCLARHGGDEENRDQPYPDPIRKCSCMICVFLGTEKGIIPHEPMLVENMPSFRKNPREHSMVCRFPGCQEQITNHFYPDLGYEVARHERNHFGKAGEYHCHEGGCQATTKKFADLRRHCLNRHCTNAIKFPCPMFGCKYGGDNGFARADKLKSHHRNVHQGKVAPGKAFQPLKPKLEGAKVIKAKPQSAHLLQLKSNVEA